MELESGEVGGGQEPLIRALKEERDKAIKQLEDEAQRRAKQNKFSDSLLRDLDEMGKALDQSRQVARQAKRLLATKEAELERLRSEKRAVLEMIIEGGPWALWGWIKKEIVEQGLEPGEDFERRWRAWLAATDGVVTVDSASSMQFEDPADGKGHEHFRYFKFNPSKDWWEGIDSAERSSLLRVVFSIFLQEGVANLQYVLEKGLFFVPLAWLWFWMSLSSRITWHVAGSISSRLRHCPLAFGFTLI